MAKAPVDPEVAKLKEDQKKFKEEQKKEKKDQKARKKEAKKKAKELAEEEARVMDGEGGGFSVFITTVIIILVWLAIICALIKLDVGGFGEVIFLPRAEIAGHGNTGTDKDALDKTDEHMDERTGGAYRRKRAVAEHIADDQRIHSVIQLLEEVTDKKRNGKADDLAGNRPFGHFDSRDP